MILSPSECPVDLAMGRKEQTGSGWCRYMDHARVPDCADLIFEYRDRSLDGAEETLHEESEYWHGMSEVGPEWFFELEN